MNEEMKDHISAIAQETIFDDAVELLLQSLTKLQLQKLEKQVKARLQEIKKDEKNIEKSEHREASKKKGRFRAASVAAFSLFKNSKHRKPLQMEKAKGLKRTDERRGTVLEAVLGRGKSARSSTKSEGSVKKKKHHGKTQSMFATNITWESKTFMQLILNKIEGPVSLPIHIPGLPKHVIIQELDIDTQAEKVCRKCCEVMSIDLSPFDYNRPGTFPYSLVVTDLTGGMVREKYLNYDEVVIHEAARHKQKAIDQKEIFFSVRKNCTIPAFGLEKAITSGIHRDGDEEADEDPSVLLEFGRTLSDFYFGRLLIPDEDVRLHMAALAVRGVDDMAAQIKTPKEAVERYLFTHFTTSSANKKLSNRLQDAVESVTTEHSPLEARQEYLQFFCLYEAWGSVWFNVHLHRENGEKGGGTTTPEAIPGFDVSNGDVQCGINRHGIHLANSTKHQSMDITYDEIIDYSFKEDAQGSYIVLNCYVGEPPVKVTLRLQGEHDILDALVDSYTKILSNVKAKTYDAEPELKVTTNENPLYNTNTSFQTHEVDTTEHDEELETQESNSNELQEVESETNLGNEATALPSGWVEVVDPETSRTYYANRTSKKSVWTIPEVLKLEEKAQIDEKDIPEGWVQRLDEGSGRYYFGHIETRKTVWTLKDIHEYEMKQELKKMVLKKKRTDS
eukprot:g3201.t1